MDADFAAGAILQISHEVDQPSVDRTRFGPLGAERRGYLILDYRIIG